MYDMLMYSRHSVNASMFLSIAIKEQQSSGVEREIMCFIFISLSNKPFQNGKENAQQVFVCMDG